MSVSYTSVDVRKYLLGCEDTEHRTNADLAEIASVCLDFGDDTFERALPELFYQTCCLRASLAKTAILR